MTNHKASSEAPEMISTDKRKFCLVAVDYTASRSNMADVSGSTQELEGHNRDLTEIPSAYTP
jgi:hypothetical protein